MAKKGSYKDFKKSGKVSLDSPEKKDRKAFAPPTKKHKPKKGKGSYDRKKSEDEEDPCWDGYKQKGMKKKGKKQVPNCVKEQKELIASMIDSLLEKNYRQAHKYLESVMESKIEQKIKEELQKPLF